LNLVCFQTVINHHMCRRNLLWNYQTPTSQRHKLRLYQFPESRHITLRLHINKQCYLNRNGMKMAPSPMLRDALSQLIKCTRCQNITKLRKLLLTHFIVTYMRKSPSSPIMRRNFLKNITRVGSATEWCQITNSAVPTNSRYRLHSPRTPRFVTARAAVILAFDNYDDCMHNYNHRNSLVLQAFLFTPQNRILLFHMQTSNPSYRIFIVAPRLLL
jgi:hypothetical protein